MAQVFLSRAAKVSGEHRDGWLKILFTLSWGNSANNLSLPSWILWKKRMSWTSPRRSACTPPPKTTKMDFLTLTFKVTFKFYLFTNQTKSHYFRIIPSCVQTMHSFHVEGLYSTGDRDVWRNALLGQPSCTSLGGFTRFGFNPCSLSRHRRCIFFSKYQMSSPPKPETKPGKILVIRAP